MVGGHLLLTKLGQDLIENLLEAREVVLAVTVADGGELAGEGTRNGCTLVVYVKKARDVQLGM